MAQCPVCLRTLPRGSLCELRCAHLLCNECITKLQQGNCPICRQSIFPAPEVPGTSSVEEVEDLLRHSLQEFLDHSGSLPQTEEEEDSTGATPFSTLLRDVFPPLITETPVNSHSNMEILPSEDDESTEYALPVPSFSMEDPPELTMEDPLTEAPRPPQRRTRSTPSASAATTTQINMFIFNDHASVDRILGRVLGAQNNPGLG